jgi:hypothetical protein
MEPNVVYEVWVTGGKRSEGKAPHMCLRTENKEWAEKEAAERAKYSTGGAVIYEFTPRLLISLPGEDAEAPRIDWERAFPQ